MVFPSGPGYRLLNTLHRDGPVHRRQHRVFFGSALLRESLAKALTGSQIQP
ncbi:hypothetical protein [Mycobacterium sp.]|uniref:hypothetical protein n=1 Tax=Mycobacterium sp. TaxID=1785 RepID=UPI003C75E1B4